MCEDLECLMQCIILDNQDYYYFSFFRFLMHKIVMPIKQLVINQKTEFF